MLIKTIQWNIGGGKIRRIDDDPSEGPYAEDGMSHIKDILKKYNADIVTLQETHADEKNIQAEIIAKNIGLPHAINDIYDKSHIEEGQGLGQAIISRFPIRKHDFKLFFNPHFETVGPKGEKWISHDKGVSKCQSTIEKGKQIQIATLHLIPFRKFGINPLDEKFENLRKNITELASPSSNIFILQGDFNFNDVSLKQFLPGLLNQNVSEALLDKPTTPKGRKYDHVLFRGLKHIRSEVITDVLTDHFPVYSEFEI